MAGLASNISKKGERPVLRHLHQGRAGKSLDKVALKHPCSFWLLSIHTHRYALNACGIYNQYPMNRIKESFAGHVTHALVTSPSEWEICLVLHEGEVCMNRLGMQG